MNDNFTLNANKKKTPHEFKTKIFRCYRVYCTASFSTLFIETIAFADLMDQ